jgi:hypothetical protein
MASKAARTTLVASCGRYTVKVARSIDAGADEWKRGFCRGRTRSGVRSWFGPWWLQTSTRTATSKATARAKAARTTLVASCGRYTVKIKTTIALDAKAVAAPT